MAAQYWPELILAGLAITFGVGSFIVWYRGRDPRNLGYAMLMLATLVNLTAQYLNSRNLGRDVVVPDDVIRWVQIVVCMVLGTAVYLLFK